MKTFKLLSIVSLGIFLLSAPAFAAIPNGRGNIPLLQQETHGYVFAGTPTNESTHVLAKTILEPNGQNDTPLLKQEAQGVLFRQAAPQTTAPVRSHNGNVANVRIGSSSEQVTSPAGMGYGGQNNIPLNLQNIS